MRVVITGGGTGGHIFPALALAESLSRLDPSGERLYIGGASGMETEIVPQAGVPFQAVTARKMPRSFSVATLKGLLALLQGYREARTYIRAFRADAVVGTGGYVAAAAVLAGARLGLPTLILGNDMVPGRTNLLLARSARKICVSFTETIPFLPAGKSVVTGLPLRTGIVLPPEITPEAARARFAGLEPSRFTLLILGGSQGARAVNNLVMEAAPTLLAEGIQILHQTGPKNYEEVRAKAQETVIDQHYLPLPFLDTEQVPLALRAANLIICRGGISTLSEAMANGLPALVIPLPTAYADHQTANAKALEAGGAALHLAEKDLTATKLTETVLRLRDDTDQRQRMAAASTAMGRPRAADEVTELILGL